jgi:glycosyltransferase involved in cell wall biosynthesis
MSVSAVITAYNSGEFVAEAIESVYAQTRLPEEVIVVDDGSTDETPQILSRFEGRPGFRSIRKQNGGEASARNAGVDAAASDYVAFLDHDDLWRPQKLERQLAEFDPGWAMSFTWLEFTTETTTRSPFTRHERWNPDPLVVLELLGRSCAVGPPSTVLMRRDLLERVGPFEQVDPFGGDWLMWLYVARAGYRIGYLPEALTEYRWHGQNTSASEHGEFFDCAREVFDRYGDRRLRAWWRLRTALYAHEHEDRRRARRSIVEATRIRPWSLRPGWLRLLF